MKKMVMVSALAALALVASPAAGQDEISTECRCVDADGNELERCSCFRLPDVEGLVARLGVPSSRPRLGISIDPAQSARHDAEGVLVTDVMEGGPADQAGIRAGDVIARIGETSLTQSMGAEAEQEFDLDESAPVQRLLAVTAELMPGTEVEVEYLRDGRRQTTMLEAEDLSRRWGQEFAFTAPGWDAERFRDQMRSLAEGAREMRWHSRGAPRVFEYRMDEGDEGRGLRFFTPDGGGTMGGAFYRDGLDLAEVNPALGAYFGAEAGVLVVDAGRSSGLGLEPGDVVVAIDGREVTSPARFRRILSSYGDDEDIDFRVLRQGEEITVTGRLRY